MSDCIECQQQEQEEVPIASTSTSTTLQETVNPIVTKTSDLMNPSTFIPPEVTSLELRIVIEFCVGCKWKNRACWVQTELFDTFPIISTSSTLPRIEGAIGLQSITLIPSQTQGIFRVWLYYPRSLEQEYLESAGGKENWNGAELVWDRKVEGGFPELKILKQRIRNFMAPTQALGHSDKDAFGNKPEKKVVSPSITNESVSQQIEALDSKKDEEQEEVVDYTPRFKC